MNKSKKFSLMKYSHTPGNKVVSHCKLKFSKDEQETKQKICQITYKVKKIANNCREDIHS